MIITLLIFILFILISIIVHYAKVREKVSKINFLDPQDFKD